MLDHPITVVLNVFDTLKNNGLKVYKSMSIQTQEEYRIVNFFLKQNMAAPIFSQELKT